MHGAICIYIYMCVCVCVCVCVFIQTHTHTHTHTEVLPSIKALQTMNGYGESSKLLEIKCNINDGAVSHRNFFRRIISLCLPLSLVPVCNVRICLFVIPQVQRRDAWRKWKGAVRVPAARHHVEAAKGTQPAINHPDYNVSGGGASLRWRRLHSGKRLPPTPLDTAMTRLFVNPCSRVLLHVV